MKKLLIVVFACFAFMGLGLTWAGTAVDLNTATQAQLESVNGIGPSKAKAIIDYRTKMGPFKSVDDLQKVTGFGEKSVAKMRSEITVSGAKQASAKPTDSKVDTRKTGK